ncbi:MAG: uroporphyrinogen-III C-methyltransferase [Wenzhouxiangellaceae bacterium]
MTEQRQHDDSKAAADQPSSTTDEAQLSAAGGDGSADQSARGRRSGPLAWIALLLALAAISLASHSFWSNWMDSESGEESSASMAQLEALTDRMERERSAAMQRVRGDLDRLADEFEDAGPATAALSERIDRLGTRVERLQGEQNTELGGVRSRLDDLETEVGRRLELFEQRISNIDSGLDRADRELATRLLLIEVDSLFAIAQDQLAVSAEPAAARRAWARGMQRLERLEGGQFRDLKEQARHEFELVEAFRPPDSTANVERLYRLAAEVGQWPGTASRSEPADASGDGTGWRARIGRVFDNLVKVENVDRAYIGPAEFDFAREQIRTTLQTAALALVRSRPDLAQPLIAEAADRIRHVFDADAAEVAGALEWLEGVAGDERIEPPSLEASRAEIARLLGGMR